MNINRKPSFCEKFTWLVLLIICISVVLIWFGWACYAPKLLCTTQNYALPGQFGDMFGALNTLFAGLAFAGLLYTIFIQRIELRDAHQEIENARQLAQSQRFESSFFQMLGLFNEIVNSIVHHENISIGFNSSSAYVAISGRKVLHNTAAILSNMMCHVDQDARNLARIDQIKKMYNMFYSIYEVELAHYFRMLYRILKWIEKAPESDKIFYAKTLRAQLSSQELVILFYDCLSDDGKKMKLLVEQYALLKHIPSGIPSEDRKFFKKTAFEDHRADGDVANLIT